MPKSIIITVVEFASPKEEALLELFQSLGDSVQTESERRDVMNKLIELGGVKALGTIALNGPGWLDTRMAAVRGIGRIGGPAAVQVLREIAKQARAPELRQLARDMIMKC